MNKEISEQDAKGIAKGLEDMRCGRSRSIEEIRAEVAPSRSPASEQCPDCESNDRSIRFEKVIAGEVHNALCENPWHGDGAAGPGEREALVAELKAARTAWHEEFGVPISSEYARFLEAIGNLQNWAEAAPDENNYVAWLRFTESGTIVTCDSDAKGAFKVYRRAARAAVPQAAADREAMEAEFLEKIKQDPTCRLFGMTLAEVQRCIYESEARDAAVAPGRELKVLASALKKVLPPDLLNEVISYCTGGFSEFLAFLRADSGAMPKEPTNGKTS